MGWIAYLGGNAAEFTSISVKAPNDGSEFSAPLVMCESLYCFQDFFRCKGTVKSSLRELPKHRVEFLCQNVEGYITGLYLQ